MPDPVEQIFLQARAPSGSGNDLFHAFSQGVRNAQENRKLSMEEAASVLQNESNRLAIQEHGLNIELKRKQMERDAQILVGQNEALDIMLMAGQDESGYLNPEIEARLHSLAIRNPAIFTAPAGQALLHNWQGARVASKAMTDAGMANLKPTRITVDPVTGKESITYGEENTALDELRRAQAYKYNTQGDAILEGGTAGSKPTAVQINSAELRTATNNFRIASDELANADTPETQAAAQIKFTQAKDALDSIRAAMHIDPEAAAARRAVTDTRIAQAADRLGIERVKLAKTLQEAGFALNPTPGTISQLPTLTPVARPMTTGALTQSQEASASAIESLAALDEAIAVTTAHPEAFGVQGKALRLAEQAKGQLNPNTPMETPIADTQQKASIAFAKVARSLRPDTGNMSRYELSKLEQAGDVLGAEVSPQEALTKQKNLRAVVLGGELRRLEARHAEPDADLLRRIPFEELTGLLSSGLLTKAQAERWYQVNRPK